MCVLEQVCVGRGGEKILMCVLQSVRACRMPKEVTKDTYVSHGESQRY